MAQTVTAAHDALPLKFRGLFRAAYVVRQMTATGESETCCVLNQMTGVNRFADAAQWAAQGRRWTHKRRRALAALRREATMVDPSRASTGVEIWAFLAFMPRGRILISHLLRACVPATSWKSEREPDKDP
jgi:hypothetical protein